MLPFLSGGNMILLEKVEHRVAAHISGAEEIQTSARIEAIGAALHVCANLKGGGITHQAVKQLSEFDDEAKS